MASINTTQAERTQAEPVKYTMHAKVVPDARRHCKNTAAHCCSQNTCSFASDKDKKWNGLWQHYQPAGRILNWCRKTLSKHSDEHRQSSPHAVHGTSKNTSGRLFTRIRASSRWQSFPHSQTTTKQTTTTQTTSRQSPAGCSLNPHGEGQVSSERRGELCA